MPAYHLHFRRFNHWTLIATEELFASKPWEGTPLQQVAKLARWSDRVSDIYNLPAPSVVYFPGLPGEHGGGAYTPENQVIWLAKPSIITMFHEFRHHMQLARGQKSTEEDARGWSLSLYYRVRPQMFKRLVRQGRVHGMTVRDLCRRNSSGSSSTGRCDQGSGTTT